MAQLGSFIRVQNLSDLELDLLRSPKGECNGGCGLPIYDYPLMSNSNHVPISHLLAVTATRNILSYLFSLGQNFGRPPQKSLPLPRGDIFFKMKWFLSGVRGKASTKNDADRCNIFLDILQTDTQNHTNAK